MILQKKPSGLGKGLGALIPPKEQEERQSPGAQAGQRHEPENRVKHSGSAALVHDIPVEMIEPNPHQPRRHFDHAQLEELITSIKEHGILQPLVVTAKEDGTYELIAGERRFRASKIAGLKKVPVIVRNATEQQKLELALIENIQRQELNPIEEAHAFTRLLQEFQLTQEELAGRVGKSRPTIANTIRLLQLPGEIQQALIEGKLTHSNARTLLSLPTEEQRMRLFRDMLKGNFTVRQTENRVVQVRRGGKDPNVTAAEAALRNRFQNKVTISQRASGGGEIKFKYTNEEELEDLLQKLTGGDE